MEIKGTAKLVWIKSQQDLWAYLLSDDFHVTITNDANTAHKAAMGNFCPPNITASQLILLLKGGEKERVGYGGSPCLLCWYSWGQGRRLT